MISPPVVAASVRAYLRSVIEYVRAVHHEDPAQTLGDILERRDVRDLVAGTFREAQAYVLQALLEDWEEGGSAERAVLRSLEADVRKAYGTEAEFRKLVGESTAKADMHIRKVALRNSMTVRHAIAYSAESAALEKAERDTPRSRKKWVAHPENPACCFWCKRLHGVTLPLSGDFGTHLGGPAVLSASGRLTKPPKTYLGKLRCPPLHPHCECRLAIVSGDGDWVSSDQAREVVSAPFLASSTIRSMPGAKYRVLIEFLRAAAHELAMILRRLGRG